MQTFGFATSFLLVCAQIWAQEFEGFTEPFETIHIASDESGVIDQLLVSEGDHVTVGQPLAKLDDELQAAQLAIATQNMSTVGPLKAAEAEVRMRRERLNKLTQLLEEGFARSEEVNLARAEFEIAEANLESTREDNTRRKLEHHRSQVLFQRRTIESPANGIVTEVAKRVGEFVAPNNPELLTIVKIDRLIANFTMIYQDTQSLRVGQEVAIQFPGQAEGVVGTVLYIAPINDAESGTTRVKVLIPNQDLQFRSGGRCRMTL